MRGGHNQPNRPPNSVPSIPQISEPYFGSGFDDYTQFDPSPNDPSNGYQTYPDAPPPQQSYGGNQGQNWYFSGYDNGNTDPVGPVPLDLTTPLQAQIDQSLNGVRNNRSQPQNHVSHMDPLVGRITPVSMGPADVGQLDLGLDIDQVDTRGQDFRYDPPPTTSSAGALDLPEVSPQLVQIPQVSVQPPSSRQTSQGHVPQPQQMAPLVHPQIPVSQVLQGPQIQQVPHAARISHVAEQISAVRAKYKPLSSVPPDLSSANYAAQCVAAATSSGLPPYRLHHSEYNLLRSHLPAVHVTTYLNIRNGILRLWLSNPLVSVTVVEAVGCCQNERYYSLAEFAFEWLVRNGFINHGCIERPVISPENRPQGDKPRQTILVVGAGVAGLSCARQIESLLIRHASAFHEYEDIPRVVVLEARRRIGGRVYTANLSKAGHQHIDLGAETVMGFGNGNPLGLVLRRQLGLPVHPIDTTMNDLYSPSAGGEVSENVSFRSHELFTHLLDRMLEFETGMPSKPQTSEGDKALIRMARDPKITDSSDERRTVAKAEEVDRPYAEADSPSQKKKSETAVELNFLKGIGFEPKQTDEATKQIHITPKPAGGSASLGQTMDGFAQQLEELVDLGPQDLEALYWHYAKYEFFAGDCLDRQSLSSWSHRKENRYSGQSSWVRDGFSAFARGLYSVPTKLDIRFKTQVKIIEYEDDTVRVNLANGEQVVGDRCVVTLPLGLLKSRAVQFIPDLPQWKADGISRLGFGVINKAILVFDRTFWDASSSVFRVTNEPSAVKRGEGFVFQNLAVSTGKPILVALFSGEAARELANRSDESVVSSLLARLTAIFKPETPPKIVESVVTRWQLDQFAQGAYSYVSVDGTVADHDLVGWPVEQTLFFAGEATSRSHPGTVHGAYVSGLRAAKEVINSIVGPIEVPQPLIPPFAEEKSSLSSRRAMYPGPVTMPNMQSAQPSGQQTPLGLAPGTASIATSNGSGHPVTTPSGANYPLSYFSAASEAHSMRSTPQLSVEELETELTTLRHNRLAAENDQMERDLEEKLGERPARPERSGNTNPFLLFQKDYWEICRQETEEAKQRDRKGHASRNEIRATLGRRWRFLPDDEKTPYIERTRQTKVENEYKHEEYLRKIKCYDVEADNFRQQWKLDHPSHPSEREKRLMGLVDELRPKRKRVRLRE